MVPKIAVREPTTPAMRYPMMTEAFTGRGRGSRLRDRRDIEHFVFLQPLELFHVFLFHKGDNDKTAAKSAGAQDEHGFKQNP